ncbi:MAG: hypothetical protein IJQ50_03485 [Clostridia bacterium]|nr:hypothetical protein [Clostridia bacterium]
MEKAIVSKWAIVSKSKKALFQELFRGFKIISVPSAMRVFFHAHPFPNPCE